MIVQTEQSVIPDDFDITPAVINYSCGKNGVIEVQISNMTTSTLVVPPRALLCELQPVNIDFNYKIPESKDSDESILDQISVKLLD